jgi:hypothetical protein
VVLNQLILQAFPGEYDFHNAVQGKHYRGDRPSSVTIKMADVEEDAQYEIYALDGNHFQFRLKIGEMVFFESSDFFRPKIPALKP